MNIHSESIHGLPPLEKLFVFDRTSQKPKKPSEIPVPGKDPETIPTPEPEPGTWPKKEPEIQPEREPLTVPPTAPPEIPKPPESLNVEEVPNMFVYSAK